MSNSYLKKENKFVREFFKLNRKKNKTRDDLNELLLKYEGFKLPCYIDILFKDLFKIRSYCAKVISYFVDLDYEYIKDNMVEYDSELKVINVIQRRSIADKVIKVGDYFILLECNVRKSNELINKNIQTFNGVSYSMVDKGKKIGKTKFIMISFDNYDQYGLDKEIYECYIKEEVKGIKESKNYKIYHVNLAKIRNVLYNTYNIADIDGRTRILGYIVNTNKELYKKLEEDNEMIEESQIIKEANEILESKTLELGDVFDKSYAAYTIDVFESGERKGRKNGITEANTNTAMEMLKDKMPIEKIIQFTSLSESKIKQLEKKIAVK